MDKLSTLSPALGPCCSWKQGHSSHASRALSGSQEATKRVIASGKLEAGGTWSPLSQNMYFDFSQVAALEGSRRLQKVGEPKKTLEHRP